MKKNKQLVSIGGARVLRSETSSLDVDAQCGFSEICPDELPVPGALDIVSELNKQADYCKFRVASKDAHPFRAPWIATTEHPQLSPINGYQDLDVHWNRHCVPGTRGFDLLPGLNPYAYDFVAYKGIEPNKHPYGACYHDLADQQSTGLIEFLILNNVKNIIVGGLATSFCVKITVLQLLKYNKYFQRQGNFLVFVNLAACRDITGVDTKASIEEMKNAGAIMLEGVCEISNVIKM